MSYKKRKYSGTFEEVDQDNSAKKTKTNSSEKAKEPQDQASPTDIDERGNIAGLIDYSGDDSEPIKINRKNKKLSKNSDRHAPKRRSKRLRKMHKKDDDDLIELVFESDYSESDSQEEEQPPTTETRMDSYSDEEDESITLHSDSSSDPNFDVLKHEIKQRQIRRQQQFDTYSTDHYDYPSSVLQPNPLLEYYNKLTPAERIELDQTEKTLRKHYDNDIPLKIRILRLAAPEKVKAKILAKWEYMEMVGTSHSEYGKLKKWLDFMLTIPWNNYIDEPIKLEHGFQKINTYFQQIQSHLYQNMYGQQEPKSIILEMIAQRIINPKSKGLVLGFEGAAGTGKTSLIRHGVAYALKRPVVNISLGGARDGALLDGSNQVFEGATCGKIINGIIEAKCMNPIFCFDELDKISDSPYGAEIANVLVHLTDPSQNSDFQDKYLELGIDLSNAVFIFLYNDGDLIDPILKDRIKQIKFTGYQLEEKITIAQKHSLPVIYNEWGFNIGDIIFPDQVLEYIINKYTDNELGMRALIHCLEMIISKLNLFRISDSEYFQKYFTKKRLTELNTTRTIHTENNQNRQNTSTVDKLPEIKKQIIHILTPSTKIDDHVNKTNINSNDKLNNSLFKDNPNHTANIQLNIVDNQPVENSSNNKFEVHYKLPKFNFPLTMTNEFVDILINFKLADDGSGDERGKMSYFS